MQAADQLVAVIQQFQSLASALDLQRNQTTS
jgi:hypothetical protein